MNKNEFNFTKWLTKKDIVNILNSVGIELLENNYNRNDELVKAISKIKTDDGKYELIVRCRFNQENTNDFNKTNPVMEFLNEKYPSIQKHLLGILSFNGLCTGGYNSVLGNDFILKFEDFFCYELFSTKNEEDEVEFGRMLTKNYQEYMTKKFGSFYKAKRNSYYKKLNKIEKQEKATAEVVE